MLQALCNDPTWLFWAPPAPCAALASQVYNFVRLSELYYAGSHGMDIMMPLGAHKAPLSSSPAPSQPAQHKEGAPDPTGAPVTGTGSGAEAGAAGEDAAGGAQQDVPMHDASCETRSSDANVSARVSLCPLRSRQPRAQRPGSTALLAHPPASPASSLLLRARPLRSRLSWLRCASGTPSSFPCWSTCAVSRAPILATTPRTYSLGRHSMPLAPSLGRSPPLHCSC